MLAITCKFSGVPPPGVGRDTVALPYDMRCRSRLRVRLASGRDAGIVLPRTERLRQGDTLLADDGTLIAVVAAPEKLLETKGIDVLLLTRAAYHLGNRHVPVQIVDLLTLRLPVDHVLAEMLTGLGLLVSEVIAPFEPEGGAYGPHGQSGSALHTTDHTHMLDRSAPIRIRRNSPADAAGTAAGLVDPGHGDHRSPRRIHEFTT